MKIMRKLFCVVFDLLVFGVLSGHEVSAASGISMRDKKISMWQGKTKQLSLVKKTGRKNQVEEFKIEAWYLSAKKER